MSDNQKTEAALQMVAAVGDAIRDLSATSPIGGVPSGELYAHCMSFLSLEGYDKVVEMLKRAKLVDERNHVLRWTGPQFEGREPDPDSRYDERMNGDRR